MSRSDAGSFQVVPLKGEDVPRAFWSAPVPLVGMQTWQGRAIWSHMDEDNALGLTE